MCGIFGIYGSYDLARAEKAVTKITHRGPDHSGIYHDNAVFLGQSRLSIIDLTELAHQPFVDDRGDYVIVFNGEIYNYRELREELAGNVSFKSESDTEVLLNAYIYWGKECLSKLIGMFSFGIWSKKEKTLFAARDRFGQKPFYYYHHDEKFIFSSEIKAIRSVLDSNPDIDKEGVLRYFSFLASPPPHTLFTNIFKLPAGHFLEYDGKSVSAGCYYDLMDTVRFDNDISPENAEKKIEELLISSVEYRMISDVEVASFLSGGIDSSLISTIFQQHYGKKIHTFSIGYHEYEQYDERQYARTVADAIGSEHHEIAASAQDFVDVFDQVVYHLDEPVNDPATLPTYMLSQYVHDHGIKVILSGEGSDEQFLGYDYYLDIMRYTEMQNELSDQSRTLLSDYYHDNFNLSKRWEFFKRSFSDQPVYRTVGESFTDIQKQKLLKNEIFTSLNNDFSYQKIEKFYSSYSSKTKDPYIWMSYIDFKVWIAEVLMMKIDKMTMAHSLEARAPFLDHRLVEAVLSLPQSVRVGNTTKSVLKKISEKYIPSEIIHRRKKGFSSPYLEWFYRLKGSTILEEWLAVNNELGWFDNEFLEYLFNQGYERKFSQHIWGLMVFFRWFKNNYM